MPLFENVKNGSAIGEQIIRDYAAMATPPHRLGTHHRTPALLAELQQPSQPGPKIGAHGVIGIAVEAEVLPKRVEGWGDPWVRGPQTPK
jgi:hypothetical protein